MALRCGIVFWAIIRDLAELAFPPLHFFGFMKLQVVFSTANFVYKFKKSENFEKPRYNANGNVNI